jgi:redox-sensitive bicupin YhaK (pirin superfamily)
VLGVTLKAGESAEYRLGAERNGYLVPATGAITVNGVRIDARDGAAIQKEDTITIAALEDSEIVLVDAA